MRVLLAFDKFKDSLSAGEACKITADALRARHGDWTFDLCPLADGGEGFAEILTQAGGGERIRAAVTGPRGGTVNASYGLVPWKNIPTPARTLVGRDFGESRIALVELAAASGLALLAPGARDPWQTTTLGTGELIRAAAQAGAGAIFLGVGGSATNDLGTGVLTALGIEFLNVHGGRVHPPVPARWPDITRVTGEIRSGLPPIYIACDVTNPLLGIRGAAAVYGPQKGLRPEDHTRMENESARLALLLCSHGGQGDTLLDVAGTGAAGGTPFGLMALTQAKLLPGFELVSAWLDLDARLAAADLVITGEGRFDESSGEGKGPGAVVARALKLGKPVHVFAGAVPVVSKQSGLSLHAITPSGTPIAAALRDARANLAASVERVL